MYGHDFRRCSEDWDSDLTDVARRDWRAFNRRENHPKPRPLGEQNLNGGSTSPGFLGNVEGANAFAKMAAENKNIFR